MRKLLILFLTLFSLSVSAQQSSLPVGSLQLSSQAYRAPDGSVWIGRDGMYFNIGSKHKTDSLFGLIQVRNLSQGNNIVINKSNPNNWIISSTGGGEGSADWGSIGGSLPDQSDLMDSLSNKLNLTGGTVYGQIRRTSDAVVGNDLPRLSQVQSMIGGSALENMTLLDLNTGTDTNARSIASKTLNDWISGKGYLAAGSNLSLLNNNVGYGVIGTGAGQIRSNSDLDARYLQEEEDPTVPAHVKTISTQNISDWNAKLEDVIAGDNITIDKTNPFKPVINALGSGGSEVTLTGDVTGTGEGSIVTTIANNAVTTAKVADKNITLDKIEDAPRRSLLGLGGGGTNTWSVATPSLGSVYNGNWNVNVFYSPGAQVNYNNILYRSNTAPTQGVPPTSNPSQWDAVKNNFRGNYSAAEGYTSNSTVFYNSQFWTTSAPISGVAPDETPVNTPGEPVWIEVSDGLTLGADNKLRSSGSSSITGLVTPGANITITGAGTPGSPYQISAAGGGGGGGSVTLIPGSGIGITGDSGSGYTITNTSPMVQASTSALGGVRLTTNTVQSIGANSPSSTAGRTYPVQLNSSGQAVVNVPWTSGGGGSDFQLRSGTNPYLTGQTTLLAGSGIQLTQSGSNITITNTEGGGGGGGGISALTGDVLASGTGSVTATIANGAVTLAKMANLPANTFIGRTGSAGTPQALTEYDIRRATNKSYAFSGTTISLSNGNKQYRSVSAPQNFSLDGLTQGMDIQVEIQNTSTGAVSITFTGVAVPADVDSFIPGSSTAIFSITNISGTPRLTKIIY